MQMSLPADIRIENPDLILTPGHCIDKERAE